MNKTTYQGLLAIGDPHLASRVPGFRRDEYPTVILRKLDWCLRHAREHCLLPCVLGDFFHWPRDNANWLLGAILEMFSSDVVSIVGNHDCAERNTLGEDDSLSVLVKSGRLRLVDATSPWTGTIGGRPVIVGGSSWGTPLPESFDPSAFGPADSRPLVVWLAHHDVLFPGYEDSGHIRPRPIPGIDVVINGHIHRPLADVIEGSTTWLNPGNIARVKRGDSTRERVPSVLRVHVDCDGWSTRRVEVPHEPFDQVFHPEIAATPIASDESAFVQGLAELVARRTESGAGLRQFLDRNLPQFDARVATEIWNLANEVLEDAH